MQAQELISCYQENRRQQSLLFFIVWRVGLCQCDLVWQNLHLHCGPCGMFQWQHAESASRYMWNLVPQASRPKALHYRSSESYTEDPGNSPKIAVFKYDFGVFMKSKR